MLRRTEYWNVSTGTVRSGATGHGETVTDVEDYLIPLDRARTSGLHGWGVAAGLRVTATVGSAGVTVLPGTAVDAAGNVVVLAPGGLAVVDPTVDPDQLQNVPTVPVEVTGVGVATAPGDFLLTLTWREVLGDNTVANAPALLHAPWLRLVAAAGFADVGKQIVLAGVTVDADGKVTALTTGLRHPAGLPAGKLELRIPRARREGTALSADQGAAAELAADADGNVVLSLSGDVPRKALTVEAATGRVDIFGELSLGGLSAVSPDGGRLVLNKNKAFARGISTPGSLAVAGLNVGGANGGAELGAGNLGVAGWLRVGGNTTLSNAMLAVIDNTPENTWNTAAFFKPACGPNWSHVHWGTTGDWYIRSASAGGKVVMQDSGGRVGVGTSAPATTLDVVGTIGLNNRLAISSGDSYLRLNQNGQFTSGVHTPSVFSSVSLNVGGAFGWGNPGTGNLAVTGRVGIGVEDLRTARLTVRNDGAVHAIWAIADGDRAGIWAVGRPAGLFWGNVDVRGTLTKANNQFRIDHPLDPAGKVLCHSTVESDEMKNVYDGVAELGADGSATVEVPEWFEALNERFRYQLTPIGRAAPGLHIAAELVENRFAIAGGEPGDKVSWQVTGVRHDVYARAHPLVVESEKDEADRGRYLFPELHGEPVSRAMGYVEPE
ncbi:hypothetical protein SAMN05421504_101822 [Amycolatopsis xylanica]|uniref:Uncharacterized protein n=1 Tax=Amycolatopsis xylanica TaxID=589385 RepID=A0A1H2U9W8_9PSEU|nr:hypothetical protein [Amycolatopsis xylanica]SDW52688.1 hypothetical protein SAMN05421504_101822 [Amycolatopsis xylanica]